MNIHEMRDIYSKKNFIKLISTTFFSATNHFPISISSPSSVFLSFLNTYNFVRRYIASALSNSKWSCMQLQGRTVIARDADLKLHKKMCIWSFCFNILALLYIKAMTGYNLQKVRISKMKLFCCFHLIKIGIFFRQEK